MPNFPASNKQPSQRTIHLRVDGSAVATTAGTAGLLEGAQQVTILKGTAGAANEVTVTFNTAFIRAPVVHVTSVTTNCHVEIKTLAVGSVVLEAFQVADGTTAVNDADYHVTITGWDSDREH